MILDYSRTRGMPPDRSILGFVFLCFKFHFSPQIRECNRQDAAAEFRSFVGS